MEDSTSLISPHPLPPLPTDAAIHPANVYKPKPSKYTSAELFHYTLRRRHDHSQPDACLQHDPRTARLTNRPYPFNLFRQSRLAEELPAVALASPLQPSQKKCPSHHGHWHESSNYYSPVECSVCLCAGDCQSDGPVFWMCDACAIRICGSCRLAYDAGGGSLMMRKYNDGSRTAEARACAARGKENVRGRERPSEARDRAYRSQG